ncbi:MAG TPA: hypothetical protein VF678_13070 [bacterium]
MTEGLLSRAQGSPAVQNYLRFMMGAKHLDRHEVEGKSIRMWFRADDDYFSSEEVVARVAIGGGFSLLHRFGFDVAEFHVSLAKQPVRLYVEKAVFDEFFKMSAAALDALAKAPEQWDRSPLGSASDSQQWQFFLKFSQYNK